MPHIRWVHPSSSVSPLSSRQVLGRDDACEIVLEGREVSRRHAEVEVDGPVVAVRDLESRNGIFINGQRVQRGPLAAGDVFRCGEWVGVVSTRGDGDFAEVVPGWFGGAALREAAEPARAAPPDLPIVVQGETGSGKEGMAGAIHVWSRRPGPLAAVNCAALPVHLAESQLFGHRRGAFTGADQAHLGFFRSAQGGTLFLDEVLELDPSLQAKLLRAVEQRQVIPVGETTPIAVDVRIVAATQVPLADAVAAGQFRADLYARLDGLTVVLPPLRQRREDVVPLLQLFLRQNAPDRPPELDHKAVEALCLHDWPLNVRELAQLARRLLTMHPRQTVLKKSHLPDAIQRSQPEAPGQKREWRRADDPEEYQRLKQAISAHQGSVGKAAAALGIQRSRAYRLLAAHEGGQSTKPRNS